MQLYKMQVLLRLVLILITSETKDWTLVESINVRDFDLSSWI